MTEVTDGIGSVGNSPPRSGDPVVVDSELSSTADPPRPPGSGRRPRLLLATFVTAALVGVGVACGADEQANLSAEAERGREVANANGCAACHGTNGQGGSGPGWQGLYGSEVELEDGTTVVADEAYLELAIVEPDAQIHAGYQLRMPVNDLDAGEVDAVVAYIRELAGPDSDGVAGGSDG
jgi:cytochrome c oxidase subunit 2